jgi:hypothetical protein
LSQVKWMKSWNAGWAVVIAGGGLLQLNARARASVIPFANVGNV